MAFRNLGIRFKTKDYFRWMNALFRVMAITYGQAITVPRKCATQYIWMLRKNIRSFRSIRPYHPRYYKWKYQEMGFTGGFWRLHDNLMNNLGTFPVKKLKRESAAYMGGIPNDIYVIRWSMFGGQHAAKEIAMYGKKAEELRPLFRPTAEQYIRAGYWDSQLNDAKKKIKGAWR